jgi:fatty acid desaturase
MERTVPPAAASLHHLDASDVVGAAYVGGTAAVTAFGLLLSLRGGPIAWATGQLLLAAAFVEWFVVLHECGHATLFRTRLANTIAGHLAGFFALIPFGMWTHVHRQHHKWTGWQDLDPTTATLVPRERGRVERLAVNVAWKLWIPLPSIVYRLGNFWSARRIASAHASSRRGAHIAAGVLGSAVVYAAIMWTAGPLALLRVCGASLLLAFVVQDLLILSQHTHVPMELSGGRPVPPHRALDQERYTRSLRLPPLASRLLLHVDAHELHHMYPFVPGPQLRRIAYQPAHEVGWWAWVRGARSMRGDLLLFANRHQTGFDL